MLFVTAFARTVARTTAALRVRNTEVSVIGIRYTSGRRGNVVRARCRVKVALCHTCVVLRMRTLVWHMHDVCAIHISGIVCTVTRSSSWCNG